MDEICRVCGEKKSVHIATAEGPFTHPRQARGEGIYVMKRSGVNGFGVDCGICYGPCGGHPWEEWKFVPNDNTCAKDP